MFGFVAANLKRLSPEQRQRYNACYCGLCNALHERHGLLARMTLTYDMVVLATGMQPSLADDKLPLPLPLDEDGFVMGGEEAGIFAAGCARMPLDVMRTAQSGTAAALKAVQTVKGR